MLTALDLHYASLENFLNKTYFIIYSVRNATGKVRKHNVETKRKKVCEKKITEKAKQPVSITRNC